MIYDKHYHIFGKSSLTKLVQEEHRTIQAAVLSFEKAKEELNKTEGKGVYDEEETNKQVFSEGYLLTKEIAKYIYDSGAFVQLRECYYRTDNCLNLGSREQDSFFSKDVMAALAKNGTSRKYILEEKMPLIVTNVFTNNWNTREKVQAYLFDVLFEDGILKNFAEPGYTSWSDFTKVLSVKFDNKEDSTPVFQAIMSCEQDLIKSGYIVVLRKDEAQKSNFIPWTEPMLREIIAKRLRWARLDKKMSLEDVASETGLTVRNISRLEAVDPSHILYTAESIFTPHLAIIVTLCNAFEIHPYALLYPDYMWKQYIADRE